MTTAAPEVDRKTFIGGSDAAGVMSMSRWKTLLQVWAEKTGAVERDRNESIAMKVGKALEPTVAALFQEETGLEVYAANERHYHPKYPFMSAEIDMKIKGEKAFLECKTCTIRKAKEWAGDDEIPTEYIIQTMHDLAVLPEYEHAYIAVVIGNEDFKWRKVLRDEKMIAEIERREANLWNKYIVPNVMPQMVTAGDKEILYKLFPKQRPGKEIRLGDDAVCLIELRNALYQDAATCESQAEKLDNEIKLKVGDAEIAIAGDWKVTWKERVVKAHQRKESRSRTFLITKLGGNTNGNR